MTGPGYEVDVDDLTGHAARLDALADEVSAAVADVDAAQLSEGAYGRFGAPLAGTLNAMQDAGRQSMTNLWDGLTLAAAEVRDAAAEYADTEEDNRERVEESGAGMDD
ncbi:type VII secretion target [Actinophytocola xanthii]|uniref:ESX-1 secretion-associated protein n=1 Tax=Actinophytocola xanthii TaxID=1912961 RepID=A0A1Q8BWG7_9PSEU|nr:type VII secretion target [Actinophytocola xanthii]OLF06424.1 hypothetical protein BU204_36350 [Actinophytocola xanthii]